jgi:integral membrane sensor domain MASE1
MRHSIRWALPRIAVLAALYVAGARLGLALSFSHEHVTSVWPPTGIAVAALMIFGFRVWPGIFIGALVANLLDGAPLPVAAGIAVGNTLAPLAAAALMRRLRVRPSLERLRDVLWLALGGGLGAMTISATLGTAVLYAAGENKVTALWRIWWVGDAMGVIILAPLLLTLF